jgi:hypothetical protein
MKAGRRRRPVSNRIAVIMLLNSGWVIHSLCCRFLRESERLLLLSRKKKKGRSCFVSFPIECVQIWNRDVVGCCCFFWWEILKSNSCDNRCSANQTSFDNKTGQSSSVDNIGKPQFRLVHLNFNEAGHGPSDTGGFLLLTTKSVWFCFWPRSNTLEWDEKRNVVGIRQSKRNHINLAYK